MYYPMISLWMQSAPLWPDWFWGHPWMTMLFSRVFVVDRTTSLVFPAPPFQSLCMDCINVRAWATWTWNCAVQKHENAHAFGLTHIRGLMRARSLKRAAIPFPFSLCPWEVFPLPFVLRWISLFPWDAPPLPPTFYPTLVGLIGITCVYYMCMIQGHGRPSCG